MENRNPGLILFAWFVGVFLFAWMGGFLGYYVATEEAVAGLREREAKWEDQLQEVNARAEKHAVERANLSASLQDRDEELAELRKKNELLVRELDRVKTAALKEVGDGAAKISNLEEALIMKAAELREVGRALSQRNLNSSALFEMQSPLTLKQIVAAKQGFNEIQYEVAAGNFKGLNLTIGYQRLRTIFDNSEMDRVLGLYETAEGTPSQ